MLFVPKIGKHTLAQVLSFAHVKDISFGILHKIDAGA
jgi:hypothetical protein